MTATEVRDPGAGVEIPAPRPDRARGSLADRVWKAWRMTPVWTYSEISRLTDVRASYVRVLASKYLRYGLIERVGRTTDIYGRRVNQYRLVDRSMRVRPCIR